MNKWTTAQATFICILAGKDNQNEGIKYLSLRGQPWKKSKENFRWFIFNHRTEDREAFVEVMTKVFVNRAKEVEWRGDVYYKENGLWNV